MRGLMVLALAWLPAASGAQEAGKPLSAIGWLEDALAIPLPPPLESGPKVTTGLIPETIAVTPLGAPQIDALGLFDPARIGLPRDIWGDTPVADVIAAIATLPSDTVPSAMQLGFRLLLAEFAPPARADASENGAILTARLDKLIAMGALEQASILIDASPVQTAALNSRAFEIALLLGEEDIACSRMQGQVAADYGRAAQIFCLARRGEWQTAWTTLNTTRALGMIDSAEAGLLMRFLAEEDEDFPLPPPSSISALGWRLLEAVGEPLPTSSLPVAFAYADLRGTSGWRAQLDAAERLTRAGVMQSNRLMGLYGQRRPAASGGVWERVRAVQALDAALESGDTSAIAQALSTAWPLFATVELELALAQTYAARLADHSMGDPARTQLWTALVLAQERPDRVQALAPEGALGALVSALVADSALPRTAPQPMAQAIIDAFSGKAALPEPIDIHLRTGAKGIALLEGLAQIAQGAAGDALGARQGVQTLRALGLDAAARQIAVELLLIERRG
jgi:hypothetical protein